MANTSSAAGVDQLRKNRLGLGVVTFLVISAAALVDLILAMKLQSKSPKGFTRLGSQKV